MNIIEKIGYNTAQYVFHFMTFGLIGKDPFEIERKGLLFNQMDRELILHDEDSFSSMRYHLMKLHRELRRTIHSEAERKLRPVLIWLENRLKNSPQ